MTHESSKSLPAEAPDIQERLLAGDIKASQRGLRGVVRKAEWEEQIRSVPEAQKTP